MGKLRHRFNARRNVYWTDGSPAWGVYDEERDPLPDGEPVAMFRRKRHATAFLALLRGGAW